MHRNRIRALMLASASIAALAPFQVAHAATDKDAEASTVGEVIIVARRRSENLQNAPVAVTALGPKTLEARNVLNLVDVSRIAPNFQVSNTPGSVGSAGVSIRGIGYGDNVIGQDSPVGIYVDGIAEGRNGVAVMDLVQPDDVEILRGPQGTLFGRNTTAGAVLITTHTPSNTFGGEAKASYGTFNAASFQARLDTGLLGDSGLKLSAAYGHRQRAGTQNNGDQPDKHDPGAFTTDAGWFKGAWEAGSVKATLAGDYTHTRGVPEMLQIVAAPANTLAYIANSPANGGNVAAPVQVAPLYDVAHYAFAGQQDIWNQGLSLNLEWKVNPNLTLKSISGLRAYKRDDPAAYGPSNLAGPRQFFPAATPPVVMGSFNGLYAFTNRVQRARQASQELQALGTVGDFDYVGGVFYFHEQGYDRAVNPFPSFNNPITGVPVAIPYAFTTLRFYTVDSKSQAAFAQIDWRPAFLDKKLDVTGGIRYTKDQRIFDQTLGAVRSATLKTNNTSYLVSANYRWTDGLMTYLKYSTGYRAGGFNVRAKQGPVSNPALGSTYQPEHLKSLEGGFKVDAFERRVRLNGAVFYNKYEDLQVSQFGAAGSSATFNSNAEYLGYELELTAIPIDHLTLTATIGHTDSHYTSFPKALPTGSLTPTAGCTAIKAGGVNVAQDCAAISTVASTPSTTMDFGAAYDFPSMSYGRVSARVDYSYRGRTEWDTFDATSGGPFKNAIAGKAYGLLSSKVTLADIPISGETRGQISVYGANLTDEHYNAQGIDFVLFGTVNYGLRRTFGIEGKVNF
jgi:iron complex outermembrane receptor protein